MALGAGPDDIRHLALSESMRLIAGGLIIGVPGTLAGGELVQGLLSGMDPTDPWALAAAGLVIVTAGLIAAWIPAARAARTDPNSALRQG